MELNAGQIRIGGYRLVATTEGRLVIQPDLKKPDSVLLNTMESNEVESSPVALAVREVLTQMEVD